MVRDVVTDHLGAHEQDIARRLAEVAAGAKARAKLTRVRTAGHGPAKSSPRMLLKLEPKARELADYMSGLSEEAYCAGWMKGSNSSCGTRS
jgi:hypothetical protein